MNTAMVHLHFLRLWAAFQYPNCYVSDLLRTDMTSDGLEPGHSAIPFDLPNANSSVGGEQVSFESVAGEN